MRRFLMITFTFLFLSACGIERVELGSWGDGSSKDSSKKKTVADSFTVTWDGFVTPKHFEKTIAVDAGRYISVKIKLYENASQVATSCEGDANLTESNYDYIMDATQDADMLEHDPAAGIDAGSCVDDDGYRNVSVEFEDADGDQNSFATGVCALEVKVKDAIEAAAHMADINVPDCTEKTLIEEEQSQ